MSTKFLEERKKDAFQEGLSTGGGMKDLRVRMVGSSFRLLLEPEIVEESETEFESGIAGELQGCVDVP